MLNATVNVRDSEWVMGSKSRRGGVKEATLYLYSVFAVTLADSVCAEVISKQ